MLKKHRCVCGRTFRHVEELMQHQQVIHGKESMYKCRECSMSFASGEDLREHARRYHIYKK
jgi:hypothetical protein